MLHHYVYEKPGRYCKMSRFVDFPLTNIGIPLSSKSATGKLCYGNPKEDVQKRLTYAKVNINRE